MKTLPISPGDVFNRWTALSIDKTGSRRRWLCRCVCGSESLVTGNDLVSGHSMSCGCHSREARIAANTKHGSSTRQRKTRAYNIWRGMIKRCYSPKEPGYPNYGGRGISICEAWRQDFAAFLGDMGEPPPGYTIERNDVNGNYEPINCRWATQLEQVNNVRSNVMLVTIDAVMTMAEFARRYGLEYSVVQRAIKRHGATEIEGVKFRVAGRRDDMQPPPPAEMVAVVVRKFGVSESDAGRWLSKLADKIRAGELHAA